MNNFEKYFLTNIRRGFKKNLKLWMEECEDYKKFKEVPTAEEVYLFYNPQSNLCQHPDCNKETPFKSIVKGFKETCCRIHAMELTSLKKYGVRYKSQLPEFREKVKNTVKEKYGVDNVFKSDKIKEKTKKTNLEKYGVENPMHNEEVKEKVKKTTLENNGGIGFQTGKIKKVLLKKYGVENPSQLDEFQEKKKATWMEKYGVENPMQNSEIQEKAKKTNLEKYGVENIFEDSEYIQKCFKDKYGVSHPMELEEIREKVSKTHKEKYSENHWMRDQSVLEKRKKTYQQKYGVDHPMQNIEIFEKNLNSCHRRKAYKWKTGEILYVQGYEPIVLSELEEKGYSFDEVKTKQTDMPEIWYFFENKKRRYFPDIYIPKENLIIEVKSEFTFSISESSKQNSSKFKAVEDAGFKFILEIR